MLIGMSAYAKDYYVYVCAESEDEVALIRFDGKKNICRKNNPCGVWPLEIEGPHGITLLQMGKIGIYQWRMGCPMVIFINTKLEQINLLSVLN
ncbi:MAG: hypothetical protein Ct9H90mP20_0580 [Candidatus Neomarinimicrobiota bacterium]|nr:MAG: hypothetical protein Ct9H90mP20_0580 [Candidatus Neomarinimicrobiota bacterium]